MKQGDRNKRTVPALQFIMEEVPVMKKSYLSKYARVSSINGLDKNAHVETVVLRLLSDPIPHSY